MNLDLGSAEQPVAYRLITLGYRFGQLDVSGEFYRIRIVITIQELADMIRLSYETTGKVLADFEANGYIAYGRQKVVVYP